jgi:hypothetical protein
VECGAQCAAGMAVWTICILIFAFTLFFLFLCIALHFRAGMSEHQWVLCACFLLRHHTMRWKIPGLAFRFSLGSIYMAWIDVHTAGHERMHIQPIFIIH